MIVKQRLHITDNHILSDMEGQFDTAHQQGASGQIVKSVKYQLADIAFYIIDRKAVTFLAMG
eukprot:12892930-Prorocentrum_lima.AAC.1